MLFFMVRLRNETLNELPNLVLPRMIICKRVSILILILILIIIIIIITIKRPTLSRSKTNDE